MTRTQEPVQPNGEWCGVSERRPCPICSSNQGCYVHEEGDLASCARVPSDWPLVTGAWLHRITLATPLLARTA